MWVWVNPGRWWWTGRPGMLRFMVSQRVRHDWVTELNWTDPQIKASAWICQDLNMPDLVIAMVMVGSSSEERLTNFSEQQYQTDIFPHHQKGKKKQNQIIWIEIKESQLYQNRQRDESQFKMWRSAYRQKKSGKKFSRQTWVTLEQSQGLNFIFLI